MKLALSTLCENPRQRTGLTTFFQEFVRHALVEFPEVSWLVFAGPEQPWTVTDARVEVVRDFPANDRRLARLWADHFQVGPAASRRGARALLTVGFLPLRTGGLPVVMHVFSVPPAIGGGLRAWYRRNAIRRGLKRAALVIVNSQWTADQLGTSEAPVLMSHEGVQLDRFFPRTSQEESTRLAGLELPREYLLWSSNFYAYKRAELAIAAYAQLPNGLRERFPFVMIGGEWGGARERARQTARALGVETNIRWLGWIDDEALPGIYRGARAFVLSTREETFGRCVTEALASGCPCVLQDLPVLQEVTAGAALWVDFTDAAAATSALTRICTDDALVHELAAKGVRRAQDFSFARLARTRVAAVIAAIASRP